MVWCGQLSMMHLTARNDRCGGGGGTRRYQLPAPTVVRRAAPRRHVRRAPPAGYQRSLAVLQFLTNCSSSLLVQLSTCQRRVTE